MKKSRRKQRYWIKNTRTKLEVKTLKLVFDVGWTSVEVRRGRRGRSGEVSGVATLGLGRRDAAALYLLAGR